LRDQFRVPLFHRIAWIAFVVRHNRDDFQAAFCGVTGRERWDAGTAGHEDHHVGQAVDEKGVENGTEMLGDL